MSVQLVIAEKPSVAPVSYTHLPRKGRGEAGEVRLFNSMVMGIQNYYQLATDISIDCGDIGRTVNTCLLYTSRCV